MPMNSDADDVVLQALLRAHQGGPAADDQACQGLVTSLAQAYATQRRLHRALDPSPGVPMAWKSGGPSRADPMRHAPLPKAGVRPSGADLRDMGLRHRWIEAEVALRLAHDVTPAQAQAMSADDAHACIDAMCVSIEVVDSRWAGGRSAAPLLKLADLLVHGALVLGEFVPYQQRDWSQQRCHVRIGTAAEHAFVGSLGIGDPAWVLPAWLGHLTQEGETVPAGTVVSTGTWCGLLGAAVGGAVLAEFPGIGYAQLQL